MTDNTETTAAPVAPKWEPEVRNGQADRRPGTVGRASWDIFDAITARKGSPASCAEGVAEGVAAGINEGQLRASYAHWRKFHGLQGQRIDNPAKAAEKAAAEQAKLDKAAAKAAEKAAKAEAKAAEKAAKDAEKARVAAEKAAAKEAAAAEKAAAKEAAAAAAAAEQAPGEPE